MRHGERYIAQLEILLPSATTVGTSVGTLVHRLVSVSHKGRIGIEVVNTLCPGIGQEGYAVVTTHTARFARERPRGQPAALLLSGQQCIHITALLRGMQNIGKWELAAEGIPEAVVGKHIAVVNLTVVRTIVIRCAVGIYLVKLAREQVGTEQAAIEGTQLLLSAALHLYAAQQFLPNIMPAFLGLLQGFIGT